MLATNQQETNTAMDVPALITAVCDISPSESANQKHHAVSRMLSSDGFPISAGGVKKWATRNSIPGDWLIRLVLSGQKRGRQIDLKNFI